MLGSSTRTIRTIIVESEDLYRDFHQAALSRQAGFEVVGTFTSAQEALEAAPALKPEVVVLDIEFDAPNGIQLGRKLRRLLPGLGVVLLSSQHDPNFINSIPSSSLAVDSYTINKSVHNLTTLGRAIQVAAAQLVNLDPQRVEPKEGQEGALMRLTPRQLEILQLIAEGLSNAAIAQRLLLSEKSVENQIGLIYSKLDIDRERTAVHPRVKAVLLYLQQQSASFAS